MKTIYKFTRWAKKYCFLAYAFMLSVLTKRKIDIEYIQASGCETFHQFSFQVKLSLPNKIVRSEVLRVAPSVEEFYQIATAIVLAKEICREQCLPPIPVFIKTKKTTVAVIVKEN